MQKNAKSILVAMFLVISVLATTACSMMAKRNDRRTDATRVATRVDIEASPQIEADVKLAPADLATAPEQIYLPDPPLVPGQGLDEEEYKWFESNRMLSVAANPFSTFAADVDTASYSHFRRYLNENEKLPPPDSIRVEEMVNYFQYDYPEPVEGEPFSVTMERAKCPWNPDSELVSIALQAEKVSRENRPQSNLVFLIDTSGSMNSEDKLPLVKRAFSLLTESLTENDRISMVTYAGSDQVIFEGLQGTEQGRILSELDKLEAWGSTHGSAGIVTAYELAEKYFIPGGNNRVLLATDGDLNVGLTTEGELVDLVEEKKKSGSFLTVLGFGSGNIKDNRLEALADHGDGQYAMIDSVFEAKRVLVEELGAQLAVVARDVKLQVEFNPEKVKAYRQIGYENRQMAAEDFDDDSKDGGELGSGHRVVALYEVILADSEIEVEEPSSRYRGAKATASELGKENNKGGMQDEWFSLNLRYKAPEGGDSKLIVKPFIPEKDDKMSENMKLSSLVATVGMKLRGDESVEKVQFSDILENLRNLERAKTDDSVEELISLVEKAAKLSE